MPLQLRSWADISSLSDEELYAVYEACEHEFPRDPLKAVSIRRIASDVVMKVGMVPGSEPLTMDLVRKSTTIPVPAIRRTFSINNYNAIVMDYIPGETLADCWGTMGLWRRFRAVWTIRGYIRQLRRVVVPGIPREELFPGPIGREPSICYGPMFGEYGGGPFASYDELTAFFAHKLEVNRRVRKTPTEDVAFDTSLPLVLTHGDLSPYNLIVDRESRLWLIDFEFSGFYPQWFEYVAMWSSTWDEHFGGGRWKYWIIGFMAGFYRVQARFLAKIAWAIEMGHFL
ncbi:kinase-like protein [Polyporus arcularius HHB13444]|uniref:Kinase-like protein n=1 Tax=Polyporus arcularius HHB13444 TaxID=1314778 RepID=A0A5C3NTS9_9APHY|nr:kinase-like protein [Polyporus arcularius HHB13444]